MIEREGMRERERRRKREIEHNAEFPAIILRDVRNNESIGPLLSVVTVCDIRQTRGEMRVGVDQGNGWHQEDKSEGERDPIKCRAR